MFGTHTDCNKLLRVSASGTIKFQCSLITYLLQELFQVFLENINYHSLIEKWYIVRVWYVSPGLNTVDGKSGWLGESGKCWVSRQKAVR